MKKNYVISGAVFVLLMALANSAHAASVYDDGSNVLMVTGAGAGGGPHIRVFNESGTAQAYPSSLFAFNSTLRTGVNVATGDIDADGQDEIIVAPKKGGGPQIRIFEKDGTPRPISFFAFHPDSRTGVSIDSGDVDGDGKDEIIAMQESNGQAWVKIYRYNNDKTVVKEWNAFGNAEVGGRVAVGDVTGDGKIEIVAGAGKGGGPQVRVFSPDSHVITQFFAFEESYRGGIDVALGDSNADMIADTIAVTKLDGSSVVKLFSISGSTVSLKKEFNAFGSIPIGTHVDLGDTNGDFTDEVIVSAANGGGPHVRIFNMNGDFSGKSFFAYDNKFRGGVDISAGYFNNNQIIAGAGDIAGCAYDDDEQTAALLDSIDGTVITTGDNVYNTGTAAEFQNCYEPTWGRHKARTRPVPGNHDYYSANAAPYFDYFGAAAGEIGKGYYSYDIGSWHMIALNSNCSSIGGCEMGSAQETWLQSDLNEHKNYCTLAYFHHPRFSSFVHGNNDYMQDIWKTMYAGNVDVVLDGHEHGYERFGLQDPYGNENTQDGIQEFIVGMGGNSLYAVSTIQPNSVVRNNTDHGVIRFDLKRDRYSWQFISTDGGAIKDSGEMACR